MQSITPFIQTKLNQPSTSVGLVTTLEGRIIDQAFLFIVLRALFDMILSLISVERLAAN
jgi:hypothetical protein